ncbi:MAG TPA: GNAT family N-acetyltransferase [Cytophagales bacterium]|jgi:[ribosomal protein S5]-alanine N-acetyltransferase|nr:GNAT family N-acetyltransferase [Cytophagales bacterium]
MQDTFVTQRLNIKRLDEEEADFFRELVNSKEWLQFIGDRGIKTKEEAIQFIRSALAKPMTNYWVVKLKDEGSIGVITFMKRDFLDYYDIGFAFLPQYVGLGYAYEAAQEILNWIVSNTFHRTILAISLKENEKSIRLLKKLGFEFDNELQIKEETLLQFCYHG